MAVVVLKAWLKENNIKLTKEQELSLYAAGEELLALSDQAEDVDHFVKSKRVQESATAAATFNKTKRYKTIRAFSEANPSLTHQQIVDALKTIDPQMTVSRATVQRALASE